MGRCDLDEESVLSCGCDQPVIPAKNEASRVSVKFAWYDLWVGAYIDRKNRVLYVCPLPCILVTVRRG